MMRICYSCGWRLAAIIPGITVWPWFCAVCAGHPKPPLLRDHPFPDPAPSYTELRNRRRTIVGIPAPERLPADAAETQVVDDPDARRR